MAVTLKNTSFCGSNYGYNHHSSRNQQSCHYGQDSAREPVWVDIDAQERAYKNVLPETLTSKPKENFRKELFNATRLDRKADFAKAVVRIASFSKYLKENMIGFVVPKYTIDGQPKGGYQWFQKGAEYLLRGCQRNAAEADFIRLAKNLYGLLAIHDNYWKSTEFIDYLSTLKPTPAIQATKQAVRELQQRDVTFTGWFHGNYFTPLKGIPELLNDGGAYSQQRLVQSRGQVPPDSPQSKTLASVDHIMPVSWGGPCEDSNYVVCSIIDNKARGNISLIDFLKGKDAPKLWT